MKNEENMKFSLFTLLKRFRWKIGVTIGLVLLELACALLYPLFIGFAINDLMDKSFQGLYMLVGLIFASLVIGSGRRFFDSRIYAKIYQTITMELVDKENDQNSSTSKISARIN